MLYSNTRTTPRSEHNWLVSAATDIWSIPPSFPHSAPTHVNPRCDDVTNLTVDGVKRFTPAVRHIHVKKKKTVNFVISVGLSAWNNSAPTGRIFMKFDIWVFFENLSRKLKFNLNLAKITGTLHEDRYTCLIISRSVLLRMRNISDKSCTEN